MDLELLEKQALEDAKKAKTQHELNEVKATYLGKKSLISNMMLTLKNYTVEERKQ